jgi:predicted nucleic acid-binding protein
VFDDGVQGRATHIVSYVVVAELFYLLQKQGGVGLFAPLLADFQTLPYYRLEPLGLSDLAALDSIREIPEMHDRLIALAAKRLGATIVTKDSMIQACQQVKCL